MSAMLWRHEEVHHVVTSETFFSSVCYMWVPVFPVFVWRPRPIAKDPEARARCARVSTQTATFLSAFSFLLLLLLALATAEQALPAPVPVAEVDHEDDDVEHQAERPDGVRYGAHLSFHGGCRNKEPVDGHPHGRAQGEDTEKEPSWEHYQQTQRVAGPAKRVPDPGVQGKDPWKSVEETNLLFGYFNPFIAMFLCSN